MVDVANTTTSRLNSERISWEGQRHNRKSPSRCLTISSPKIASGFSLHAMPFNNEPTPVLVLYHLHPHLDRRRRDRRHPDHHLRTQHPGMLLRQCRPRRATLRQCRPRRATLRQCRHPATPHKYRSHHRRRHRLGLFRRSPSTLGPRQG